MGRRIGFVARTLFVFAVLGLNVFDAEAVSFDKNVPKETQTQLIQDLQAMEVVQGSAVSSLHQAIYGQMEGKIYTQWFGSRVLRVGYDPSGADGAVAYVSPFMDPSRMVLTSNYTRFSHPQIARLMIVFHEARHTERQSGHWPHATCPRPFLDESGQEIKSIWTGLPLAGESACDSRVAGAYASTVILLGNISRHCETCSEKMKMDAEIYGMDQLKRVTNATAAGQIRQDVFGIN